MRLRYTEAANQDLTQLLADTAQHWPRSMARTTERLARFEDAILRFPLTGRRTRFAQIRRYDLRPLPYYAFYRVGVDEIEVLRLYHTARLAFDTGTP